MKTKVRCIVLIALSFLISSQVPAADFKSRGDHFFELRNEFVMGAPSAANIDSAVYFYKQALAGETVTPDLLYKYTRAVDFKYMYFCNDKSVKRRKYKELIELLEKAYPEFANSAELNYSLALAWGRYGELIGVLRAAKNGIAGKVKFYGEKLYFINKDFKSGAAGVILGRLHYITPRLPFILTWPNLKKSEQYLAETVEKYPSYLRAKLYLADTLWKVNDKSRARYYYNAVMTSRVDPKEYMEQTTTKKECVAEMKKKGINK